MTTFNSGDLDDGHCTVIEEQLSQVRDLYDELKVKYRDHAKNLESALNMCNRYQVKRLRHRRQRYFSCRRNSIKFWV